MTVKDPPPGKDNYYVYALSTKKVGKGNFDPNSIFYVGKGIGKRWYSHFLEARKAIAEREQNPDLHLSDKHLQIERLIKKAGKNPARRTEKFEEYAYFIKGNLSQNEALTLEALTIELLRSSGVALTNKVSGHHATTMLKPAAEVRKYYEATRMDIKQVFAKEITDYAPGGKFADRDLFILVKGSTEDMSFSQDVFVSDLEDDPESIDHYFADRIEARFPNGVAVRALTPEEDDDAVRRGWNPLNPWTDEEARERARHYWPISASNVEKLQSIAAESRLKLCLLIQDPRAKQSTIRYAWEIEPDGLWLDYKFWRDPADGEDPELDEESRRYEKIGFPLGESLGDNFWALGHTPHRDRDGNQILRGLAHGVGFADFTNAQKHADTDYAPEVTLDPTTASDSES